MPRTIDSKKPSDVKLLDFGSNSESTNEIIDYKYKVRLPAKSTSTSFHDARKIIDRNPHWVEERFQFVGFKEATNDLEKLITLCQRVKGFLLFINNEELERINDRKFAQTIFCKDKEKCQGICTHRFRSLNGTIMFHTTINEIITTLDPSTKVDTPPIDLIHNYHPDVNYLKERILGHPQWCEIRNSEKGDSVAIINYDKIIEDVLESLNFEETYCPIFNKEAISEKIQRLPNEIKIDTNFSGNNLDEDNRDENEEDEEYLEVELSDKQLDLLTEKIAKEMEKVLRKLFKEAGFINR